VQSATKNTSRIVIITEKIASRSRPRFGHVVHIEIPVFFSKKFGGHSPLLLSLLQALFIMHNPLATRLTDKAQEVSAPKACKITIEISITGKRWSSVAMRTVKQSSMTQQALLLNHHDLNDSMVERHATVSAK
jgi:hypothetical protein